MRIGIISDVHEDVASLTRALHALERRRCDQVVSLGDIVGVDNGYYGSARRRDADQCIRLIREHCSVSVAGNHDLFAIRRIPSFTARFRYPPGWYSVDLESRQRLARGRLWDYSAGEERIRLSDASREYLGSLPEFATLTSGPSLILLSHHLFPDLSGSLRRMPGWSPDIWPHLKWMKKQGCRFGITGHIHAHGWLMGNPFCLHNSLKNSVFAGTRWPWISAPPVTTGGVANGFLVLESEPGLITTHPIDNDPLS